LIGTAVILGVLSAYAQVANPAVLAAGKLLVAQRDAPDPRFARTVIVLVKYDSDGVVGLTINRRTRIPLSRVLQELNVGKDRADPVFAGGPVEIAGVLALLRARTRPEEATRVIGDVYLVSTRPLLEKCLADAKGPDELRVFLGYSGWAPGQLQAEVKRGFWHVVDSTPALIFDPNPGSLWTRLIEQTEQFIAGIAGFSPLLCVPAERPEACLPPARAAYRPTYR
jgi:putative transcriptional regulator